MLLTSFIHSEASEEKILGKKFWTKRIHPETWLVRLNYYYLLLFSEKKIIIRNSFFRSVNSSVRACVGLSPDPEVNLIRCWGRGLCVMTNWNNWIFDLRAAWKTNCMSLSLPLLLFASYGSDLPHYSQRVEKKQKLVFCLFAKPRLLLLPIEVLVTTGKQL